MRVLKRSIMKRNERGLLYSEGNFLAALEPGTYHCFDPYDRLSLEGFSLSTSQFGHCLVGYLRQSKPQLMERYFTRTNLGDSEAGLRHEGGVLVGPLAPGSRRLYQKGQTEQRLERIDPAQDYRLSTALVAQLHRLNLCDRALTGLDTALPVQVPAFQADVPEVGSVLAGLLQARQCGFWRYNWQVSVELVDTRIQVLRVSGQETLTRDKTNLHLNFAANWRYNDVPAIFSRLSKPLEYLYRELQFGLRVAVGTRTPDELLENRRSIDEVVSAHLATKLKDSGLEVSDLGVRDIILPGEMKTLLVRVVGTEKVTQTNVIRHRRETLTTCSLLNTAKVMEENPTVLRLKGLETLERMAEYVDRTSVFGGLDQVLNGLVTLKQA